MHLRIGTRSSPLALAQTKIFVTALQKQQDISYEVVEIKTTGDLILNKPLYEIGGKALFLKELEEALLEKKIDVAVHSLKDVPGILDERFSLACFLPRECPNDSFVSKSCKSIKDLPFGAKVGTSSPRRAAFLLNKRSDLNLVHLRGNVNSRIERIKNNEYDAIILAEIGLRRLNLYDVSLCNQIDIQEMIPAVGQGVVTCEILKENSELFSVLEKISDPNTAKEISIERSFLEKMQADCKTPVAAHVQNIGANYHASFMVGSNNLERVKIMNLIIEKPEAKIGEEVASEMIKDFLF